MTRLADASARFDRILLKRSWGESWRVRRGLNPANSVLRPKQETKLWLSALEVLEAYIAPDNCGPDSPLEHLPYAVARFLAESVARARDRQLSRTQKHVLATLLERGPGRPTPGVPSIVDRCTRLCATASRAARDRVLGPIIREKAWWKPFNDETLLDPSRGKLISVEAVTEGLARLFGVSIHTVKSWRREDRALTDPMQHEPGSSADRRAKSLRGALRAAAAMYRKFRHA